jgi:hypothetical protein
MPEDGLDEAARRVIDVSRDDPLVQDEETVRQMLDDAFFGRLQGVTTPDAHPY